MKKILIFITCVIVMLSSVLALSACVIAEKLPTGDKVIIDENEWTTTFFDDFKGNSLDTTKWRINTMASNNGIRRAGYYVDDEDIVFVKDDNLTIRTRFKDGKHGNGWYTSWVETSTKDKDMFAKPEGYQGFSAKGGYFEVRCKAPRSKGIWSAFWLMPDEGVAFSDQDIQNSGKDGAEIDIMESFGWTYGKSDVTHVLHADGFGSNLKTDKSKTYRMDDMYDTYHTYALEWTADKYIFYVDGSKTWETSFDYKGTVMGVSEVLEHLILSVEVAGVNDGKGEYHPGKEYNNAGKLVPNWAGNPNDNDKAGNYDFIIDYVKVMQRK